jgi:GTP diphosphokinase / guanosine-3',5'-bis(diphosphate) 3'-diphosphatase
MSSFVENAKTFALAAHTGIFRPNKAHEPYSIHIQEVAELVKKAGGSKEEEAAAWLHDVVEDTNIPIEKIYELFGKEVGLIVEEVTDPKWPEEITILDRKKAQAKRIKKESSSAKRVKEVDLTSNVKSVIIDSPIDWTHEKCRDYIMGAKLIIDECRGTILWLEKYFDELYAQAQKIYNF